MLAVHRPAFLSPDISFWNAPDRPKVPGPPADWDTSQLRPHLLNC